MPESKKNIKKWLDPNGKKAEIDGYIAMANALITKAEALAKESNTPLAMKIDAWKELPTRLYLSKESLQEKKKFDIDESEIIESLSPEERMATMMLDAIEGWDCIGVDKPGWTFWRASSLEC